MLLMVLLFIYIIRVGRVYAVKLMLGWLEVKG